MPKYQKKDRRDRSDRIYLKGLDSMHIVMPYVMPRRCDNEAVLSELIDITALQEYVNKKNSENPEFKYTWFQVICAALAKVLILRPKMNYFISGYRMFERREIEVAFTIKKTFDDKSEEALAKVIVDRHGESPMKQMHDNVQKYVTAVRVKDETKGITNQFNFFSVLPRFAFRIFVALLRVLEYYGIYPKAISKDDPCFCSVYITNLGSIKMNADYHHLFSWGNNSFFVIISEKKKRPIFKDDGTYEMRDTLKLGLTIDERIADGYYFAKSLRLLKKLLQNPELLDLPADAPIDYE